MRDGAWQDAATIKDSPRHWSTSLTTYPVLVGTSFSTVAEIGWWNREADCWTVSGHQCDHVIEWQPLPDRTSQEMCAKCGGLGGYEVQCGPDEVEDTECLTCDGTGKVIV